MPSRATTSTWREGSKRSSPGNLDQTPRSAVFPRFGCIDLESLMPRERIVFVTGKLAEYSLRRLVERLSDQVGFEYRVAVLPISVAALMQAEWVARKLVLDDSPNRVVLPGWCQGELD